MEDSWASSFSMGQCRNHTALSVHALSMTLGQRREPPLFLCLLIKLFLSVNYLDTDSKHSCGAPETSLKQESMEYFSQYHCEHSKWICHWREMTKSLVINSVPSRSQIPAGSECCCYCHCILLVSPSLFFRWSAWIFVPPVMLQRLTKHS